MGTMFVKGPLPLITDNCRVPASLLAAFLFAASAASSSVIALTTTVEAAFRDGNLELGVTVRNDGDEAASSLRPTLRFRDRGVDGEVHSALAPGGTLETALRLPLDRLGPGRWPFRLDLSYADNNAHPFNALHVSTFTLGSVSPEDVELEVVEVPRFSESGELQAHLTNSGTERRSATLSLLVPPAIEARPPSRGVVLEAGEKKALALPLTNRSAASGDR
ncbi:MAG: hypothetical protein OES47_14040, partial [Acidobacteriota bacterium]|nr:hypothetical protein [Acidobacteriota bacterium]